jgi:type I restriction enzyme M protein
LEAVHIKKIVDAYNGMADVDKFMRIVDMAEIEENDHNLNIARYIDTNDEEEPVDLEQTLENIKALEEKECEIDVRLQDYLKELGLAQ